MNETVVNTPELIEALAKRITDDLFTNGFGERADRLVLQGYPRELGGWSYDGAYRRILVILASQESKP